MIFQWQIDLNNILKYYDDMDKTDNLSDIYYYKYHLKESGNINGNKYKNTKNLRYIKKKFKKRIKNYKDKKLKKSRNYR